jgi:YVTN family beta-propeller protein
MTAPLSRRRAAFGSLASLAAFGQTSGTAPGKGIIVATCKGNHTIAFVDPDAMRVTSRLTTGEGPHEVCSSSDGRTAYATIYGVAGKPGNQIAVLDPASRTEIKRISVAPLRSPHGIVECQGKIWFTAEQSRAAGRLDPATGAVDWVMGTGAFPSHMLVLTPDASKLYTADILDGTVTSIEIKATPGRPPKLTHIKTGERTEGIAISPDGREVWAGNNTDGNVYIIDTASDKVIAQVPSSRMSFRLTFTADGKTVYVAGASGEEVVAIDAATRKITGRIATPGAAPQGLLLHPTEKNILYTATGIKILKMDTSANRILAETEVGPGVDSMAWGAV